VSSSLYIILIARLATLIAKCSIFVQKLFPTRCKFVLCSQMKQDDSQRNHKVENIAAALLPISPTHPISGVRNDAHHDTPPFDPVPVLLRQNGGNPPH
jgi:hypothetical protein